MIIDVPYFYEAEVRRPRKQKAEEVTYRASVPVEVREITAAEAPLAIRCEDPNGPIMDKGVKEYRWFEDDLWSAYRPSDGSGMPRAGRDAAWLLSVNEEPNTYNNPLGGGAKSPYRYTAVPMSEDLAIAEVRKDGSEAVAAGIRHRADGIVPVDGMIWHRAVEPVLTFNQATDRGGPRGYVWVRAGATNEAPHTVFRIDEGHTIQKATPEIYGDYEPEFLPELKIPYVEVLIPEAVRYRATERALAEAGQMVIDEMKKHVVDQEVDYFVAFANLRKATAKFASRVDAVDDEECDAFVDVIRHALEAEKSRPAAYEWQGIGRFLLERIEGTIIRHELRKGDLEALATFAP